MNSLVYLFIGEAMQLCYHPWKHLWKVFSIVEDVQYYGVGSVLWEYTINNVEVIPKGLMVFLHRTEYPSQCLIMISPYTISSKVLNNPHSTAQTFLKVFMILTLTLISSSLISNRQRLIPSVVLKEVIFKKNKIDKIKMSICLNFKSCRNGHQLMQPIPWTPTSL